MSNKKIQSGTKAGYKAGMGGKKIRSAGQGKGLQKGAGAGPRGIPIKKKN